MQLRIYQCLTIWVIAILSSPSALAAQDAGREWSVDGSVGLFGFGTGATDSGLLFQWSVSASPTDWLRIGTQGQFRDDVPSEGRSQALGVGVVGRLFPSFPRLFGQYLQGFRLPNVVPHLYVPAGALLEVVYLGEGSSDPTPGVYVRPRGFIGLGIEARGESARRFTMEGQASYGFDGRFLALMVGLRSTNSVRAGDHRLTFQTSDLSFLNSSYQREEEFRGYGVRYEGPVDAGPIDRVRASLGLDFLVFETTRRWSTGALSGLVGGRVPIVAVLWDRVLLSVVADGGIWRFSEGAEGHAVYPSA
jgi:hypothetical protein